MSGYTETRIAGCPDIRMTGHQGTWAPEAIPVYQDSWIPGSPNTKITEYPTIRIPEYKETEYPDTRIPGYLGTRLLGCRIPRVQDIWLPGFLETRIAGYLAD